MRDYQYKSHQWLAGKAWARSTPLGPFLVTPDEVGDPHALDITLELNGERMQDANTRLFIFDIPTIVATISEFTPLRPGDVVLTGTPRRRRLPARPEGAAARRRPDGGRDRARRAAREPRSPPSDRDGRRHLRQPRRGERPRARLVARGRAARARTTRSRRRCRGCWRRSTRRACGRRSSSRGSTPSSTRRRWSTSTRAGTRSPATAGATSAGRGSTRRRSATRSRAASRGCGRSGWRRVGFRPPGGELTAATPALLRELGFSYCSPAAGVDRAATCRCCRSAGSCSTPTTTSPTSPAGAAQEAPLPPSALRETVFRALDEADGFLALLFHPFLADTGGAAGA